nr:hypothetical protein Iba_chr03aCG6570 [Ipomoea batatas]
MAPAVVGGVEVEAEVMGLLRRVVVAEVIAVVADGEVGGDVCFYFFRPAVVAAVADGEVLGIAMSLSPAAGGEDRCGGPEALASAAEASPGT